MPNPVQVTRVSVEFIAKGKPFTVVLDPTKVQSIVFDGQFMKQLEINGFTSAGAPQHFPAGKGIPREVAGHSTSVMESSNGSTDASRAALWWMNDKGVWFHPED